MPYSSICQIDNSLREYQQQGKQAIFSAWDEVASVMFQMPTGTGKTRLFSSIIKDIHKDAVSNKKFFRILIVAHRTELLDQIHDSLFHVYNLSSGYIAGGHPREPKFHIQIASIQTLSHPNNREYAKSLKIDYVIIDEAHHAIAETYQLLWKLYPQAKRLGVTATPYRMSGCGFRRLFDKLILSWPVKKFIAEKYLSSYQYYSLKPKGVIDKTISDINEFAIDGDYKTSALERVMDQKPIRAQLWDSYNSLARGKKGIIYAICQSHSEHICEEFSRHGIKIKSIDSRTPANVRKQLVSDFKRGEIQILVNVDIFSEGFDCPDIEFIQLARPTRSLAKYLQQVGRALRTFEGKENAIILDNVGMYSRFGLPDARRHWDQHFLGINGSVEELSTLIQSQYNGISTFSELEEGNEPMVLIQQTCEPILLSLTEDEKLLYINELKSGIINHLVERAAKEVKLCSNRTRQFLNDLSEILSSEMPLATYLLCVEKVLEINPDFFINSISNVKNTFKDNITETDAQVINRIATILCSSSLRKITSSINILLPFKEYLTTESKQKLQNVAPQINSPSALLHLYLSILKTGYIGTVNRLMKIRTNPSMFAIYQILLHDKKRVHFSTNEVRKIADFYKKMNGAGYVISEMIEYHVLGEHSHISPKIIGIEKENYEQFNTIAKNILAKEISKNNILALQNGETINVKYQRTIKNHYIFTNNQFQIQFLLPKEVSLQDYSITEPENLSCRIVRLYKYKKIAIIVPSESKINNSVNRPILDIGDVVNMKFSIFNKKLSCEVSGYRFINASLVSTPQDFNYKNKYKAVAVQKVDFFTYKFRIDKKQAQIRPEY